MLKKLLPIIAILFAATAFAAIDVNTASEAELDGVRGIGPGLSGKILAERKQGEFKDWNDFIGRVRGIGSQSAVRLSGEGLTVSDKKYSTAAAARAEARDKKHGNTTSSATDGADASAGAGEPSATAPSSAGSAGASKN